MQKIKVTCIFENMTFNRSFFAGLGQSLLLEVDDKKYLFDTAENYDGLTYNMKRLGIELTDIQTVILSHNHLDHSGSLFRLYKQFTQQQLFLPPDMRTLDEKNYDVQYRTEPKDTAIQHLLEYKKTTIVREGIQIAENMYTTGALEAPDKEQSLVVNIPGKGLVLLMPIQHSLLLLKQRER
ncbi:MAG: MBL fold metallo-hydrolase [Patescibacteria group bacterium]